MVNWTLLIGTFILYLLLGMILTFLGAKVANVGNATISKIFVAALIGAILIVGLCSIYYWAAIFGAFLIIVVYRVIFKVTWIVACYCAVFYLIVIITAIVIPIPVQGWPKWW